MSSAPAAPGSRPVLRTPLHHWHSKRQARFVDLDGWQTPASFTGVDEEVAGTRQAAGIVDLSAFAKLSLRGPALAGLKLEGKVAQPRGVSTYWSDGPILACRLAPDRMLLLASTTNVSVLEKQRQELAPSAEVIACDETSAYAGFGLLGPRIEELVRHVSPLDLSILAEESCAETRLAGVQALLIRPAKLPVPSLRLYVSWDLGEYVWETLFEKSQHIGLTPIGLEAWKRLS